MLQETTLHRFANQTSKAAWNAPSIAHTLPHAIAPTQISTNESPGVALLRHFLFPSCTVLGLLLSAAIFQQSLTRPYIILSVLSFALSWRLLDNPDFRGVRPISEIEYFIP